MSLYDNIKKGIACDSVGKPDSAIGRAICLSVHPGKMVLYPLHHWFEFHYKNRYRFSRIIFGIDVALVGIVLALASVAIYATFFLPGVFVSRIAFDASIAPREVTTGASSTLVIHYTNGTDENLRNAELEITFPKHFLLDQLSSEQGELIEENRISLGTIPPSTTGTIHMKGTLFGDVGGEQAFETKLTFVHGKDRDEPGEKIDWQIFSPVKSALTLSLELPERLISYQPIEGTVRYENTSGVDFPTVSILPQWPEGFVFKSADVPLRAGQFEIPQVKAGGQGVLHFKGTLQSNPEQVTFVFHPSFTFGDERYRQETLTHTAPIVPLPVTLTIDTPDHTLHPGAETPFSIHYKNTAAFPVSNVELGLESDSPFVKISATEKIDTLQPGQEGTVEVKAVVRTTVGTSELSAYEHLIGNTLATATYQMGDGTEQQVISKSAPLTSPLSTPIRFESFVRYLTPGGDQIGRGPVPPQAGKETTYWVFWHIGSTTNELNDVRIEGTLPPGVRFTGRQTVSQNSSVSFDPDTRTLSWTSSRIDPTLSPISKIVGIAFELGITPQVASSSAPILLKDIRLTATDGWTREPVFSSAPTAKALLKRE
ncbi:hypothetical protein HZA85_02755 [Candidatus Uhrbacteria bacterium]|nr:hypothetical protein [Candidatus Uhrbacteria bacterium]